MMLKFFTILSLKKSNLQINPGHFHFRAIRQELAILIPLNHENIVKLLGVIVSPFAMLLELADGGSLDNYYKMYQKEDKKINPYVVQVALQQVSDFFPSFVYFLIYCKYVFEVTCCSSIK